MTPNHKKKPFDDVHRVRTTIRKAIERRQLVSMFAHDLNERVLIDSFYGALDHWSIIIKALAGPGSVAAQGDEVKAP